MILSSLRIISGNLDRCCFNRSTKFQYSSSLNFLLTCCCWADAAGIEIVVGIATCVFWGGDTSTLCLTKGTYCGVTCGYVCWGGIVCGLGASFTSVSWWTAFAILLKKSFYECYHLMNNYSTFDIASLHDCWKRFAAMLVRSCSEKIVNLGICFILITLLKFSEIISKLKRVHMCNDHLFILIIDFISPVHNLLLNMCMKVIGYTLNSQPICFFKFEN